MLIRMGVRCAAFYTCDTREERVPESRHFRYMKTRVQLYIVMPPQECRIEVCGGTQYLEHSIIGLINYQDPITFGRPQREFLPHVLDLAIHVFHLASRVIIPFPLPFCQTKAVLEP